jgi:hypothetical protein
MKQYDLFVRWRKSEVVPVVAVVLLEVKLHLLEAVSTRDVFDHNVGSRFLAAQNLVKVYWSAVVVAAG